VELSGFFGILSQRVTTMLTRLRVSGFKNLVDVDVRFGPFTCIAGANGSGKSNLFDAIHLLSCLADRPLLDAALSVRDESGKSGNVTNLFHCVAGELDREMRLEAEMIIPRMGEDDLGQQAKASITSLKYEVSLRLRKGGEMIGPDTLELVKEELSPIRLGLAHEHFPFPQKVGTWRKSAVVGRRGGPFISTTTSESDVREIKLHQDGGSRGRPVRRSATNLPRTVLSTVNAAESPTATLARKEMRSWSRYQLEPSALRMPASFTSPKKLGPDGSNLPSTLYRLAGKGHIEGDEGEISVHSGAVYARLANRLSELIDDVREIRIDRDEKRELLNLFVRDKLRTRHPAMALSDGTLRFLALAVLELDPEFTGVVCLEEPENGIHPERIPAMLQLLQDIATDTDEEVGPDNPLRQVIINTHSPTVVAEVPDESLVLAELIEESRGSARFTVARFSALSETWRCKAGASPISKGKLLGYLNPIVCGPSDEVRAKGVQRVKDRKELSGLLWPDT
jgi:predicted ATPase